jgi:hypothetical protein
MVEENPAPRKLLKVLDGPVEPQAGTKHLPESHAALLVLSQTVPCGLEAVLPEEIWIAPLVVVVECNGWDVACSLWVQYGVTVGTPVGNLVPHNLNIEDVVIEVKVIAYSFIDRRGQ